MPVTCPLRIEALAADQFGELDFLVMGHAFDSQNSLGRLADERIYRNDLALRLTEAGLRVDREVPVHLSYGSFSKKLLLDIVVAEQAVYELKAVRKLDDMHFGQLLTYLLLLDLPRGKLVNFRSPEVESRFVNAPLLSADRREFRVDDSSFDGEDVFRNTVIGLLRDWGTSLTLSLYMEALVTFFGGADTVDVMMPLMRHGHSLGKQRFHLASGDCAFRLTAMKNETGDYRKQLQSLLDLSPLRSCHWLNIAHHQVTITTIKHA